MNKRIFYAAPGLAAIIGMAICSWNSLRLKDREKVAPQDQSTSKQPVLELPRTTLDDRIKIPLTDSERIKEDMLNSELSINVFGLTTDERGQPIGNVKMNYVIHRVGAYAQGGGLPDFDKGQLTSDASGGFELLNKRGLTASISSVEKLGFHGADLPVVLQISGKDIPGSGPSHRVKIVMIHDGAAKLVPLSNKRLKIPFNGSKQVLDTGIENVRLKFSATREKAEAGEHFPWSVEVWGDGADLVWIKPGDAFVIPMDGYANSLRFSSQDHENWTDAVHADMAYRTKSGKLGKISLDIYCDREGSPINSYIDIFEQDASGPKSK